MANLNNTEWDLIFDEEIWKIYPPRKGVRQGKVNAKLAFGKHKTKTRAAADKIIGAINYLKITEDWTKDDGQFIPLCSTFLNPIKKKWEIEFDSPLEEQVNKDVNGTDKKAQASPTKAQTGGDPAPQEKETVPPKEGGGTLTPKQQFMKRLGYDI